MGNAQKLARDAFAAELAQLAAPVDRTQWAMSGVQIDAYYEPTRNQMVFPAGILQSPYFDATFHPARNFGGLGGIVGHEMTHAFDSTGRLFDGDGNLRSWWTNASASAFDARASCLVSQYDAFQVHSTTNASKVLGTIDGARTLGENLADSDGLQLAYAAYQAHKVAHKADGSMTPRETDQLFFVAYSHSWCGKATDEWLGKRLKGNVHSPAEWRVNGPVMNNAAFAAAFQCAAGTNMNPTTKCGVY